MEMGMEIIEKKLAQVGMTNGVAASLDVLLENTATDKNGKCFRIRNGLILWDVKNKKKFIVNISIFAPMLFAHIKQGNIIYPIEKIKFDGKVIKESDFHNGIKKE